MISQLDPVTKQTMDIFPASFQGKNLFRYNAFSFSGSLRTAIRFKRYQNVSKYFSFSVGNRGKLAGTFYLSSLSFMPCRNLSSLYSLTAVMQIQSKDERLKTCAHDDFFGLGHPLCSVAHLSNKHVSSFIPSRKLKNVLEDKKILNVHKEPG